MPDLAPTASAREPAFRVGARAIAGALAVELVLGLTLALTWRLAYGGWLPWQLGGYLVGFAVGAGAAFALAEGAGRRWGAVVGLALGLLAAPLALVGAELGLGVCQLRHPLEQLAALDAARWTEGWRGLVVFLGAALGLGAPLVVGRLRGWTLARQVAATTAGAGLFAACLAVSPAPWGHLLAADAAAYALWTVGRAALLPPAWRLGDRAVDLTLRALGQAPPAAIEIPPGVVDRERRQRARAHAQAAQAHERAGDLGAAADAFREAFMAWPTRERAGEVARVLSLSGDPELAAAYADASGEGDRAVVAWPWAVGLAAGLLVCCLPAALHPGESASTWRLRLLAVRGDVPALLALGEHLVASGPTGGRVGDPSSVGLPAALQRLGAAPPLDASDPQAAAQPLRRAALRGDPEAMVRYAELRESYGRGADRSESVAWYRRAAEAGHLQAMRQIAFVLETGWGGVSRDTDAALGWYQRAARETGDVESTVQAARLLESAGRTPEARALYRDAVAKGHPGAEARLRALRR